MARVLSVIVLASIAVCAAQQLGAQPSRGAFARGTIAITNVNVDER